MRARPAQPSPRFHPGAAAAFPSLPFLLSCGASTTLLVRLQCVCHGTKPKMQATATLLALTDPRGDKYVCLPLRKAGGKRETDQTVKWLKLALKIK